ncbi:bacteriorhodopsin-like [Leptolyngbya iicbica]|uniref:Xanthorhodopsin n=2 Tax=Cyanophyceae TaxID=3028117 RepID=A0A4Q7E4T5_9CYAN|nr:bacteriorhodopsin-like [Leptolyngbya sp. LK]RZM77228.1 xanthorhodopsin [Leptolyngbya sp. LK]
MEYITIASVPTELTANQFSLVYNAFSLCIAAMFAAALFFFNAKSQVGRKYQVAVIISGVVVSIAGYHYFRIFNSWEAAYALQGSTYLATEELFNDAYRYVDWLLTVPLLLIEAVAVLALSKEVARPLLIKLATAAVLMIGTGYVGEVADSITTRAIWGAVSTLPFLYILFILWTELSQAVERQDRRVKTLLNGMRFLLLFSWGVYPIAYLLPELGIAGATATVGVQVGYTIADLLAKPVFGLLVFSIARVKTQIDEAQVADQRPVTDTNGNRAEDLVGSTR